jgi:hypothetical protein
MHCQIVAVAFLAVALAAPQGDKKPIEIVIQQQNERRRQLLLRVS